jgi:hypothetical protein
MYSKMTILFSRKHISRSSFKHNKTTKTKIQKETLRFPDYIDFRPNITPRQMFRLGSFGGTYWRSIYSRVTGKNYKNVHSVYFHYKFNSNLETFISKFVFLKKGIPFTKYIKKKTKNSQKK